MKIGKWTVKTGFLKVNFLPVLSDLGLETKRNSKETERKLIPRVEQLNCYRNPKDYWWIVIMKGHNMSEVLITGMFEIFQGNDWNLPDRLRAVNSEVKNRPGKLHLTCNVGLLLHDCIFINEWWLNYMHSLHVMHII